MHAAGVSGAHDAERRSRLHVLLEAADLRRLRLAAGDLIGGRMPEAPARQ